MNYRPFLKHLTGIIILLILVHSHSAYAQRPATIPEVMRFTPGESTFTPENGLSDPRISFTITNDKELGDEGYAISITSDKVSATAPTEKGLFYARQTLLQILEQGPGIPCGNITDKPAYALRGFMIDCGRKYIPISYLHELVDVLAYYKMNTLQIHLNDNGFRQYFGNDWNKTYAAFRLQCDTYPGLTSTDGFYTKAEFIELQKHAEKVGVEIIPEIDVPAHCLAFTHYDPELGSDEFGMDHLDLRKPEKVYPFVDGLFREYLEGDNPVFRGHRVNIGTDEYSNRDSTIVEEFRRFTDHYIRLVESYGKQAMLWGSLTHAKGVTPVKAENVLMSSWSGGYAKPLDMKNLGYQLVSIPDGYVYIVPAAGYYYDYLNCQFLYNQWTPAQMSGARFDEGDPCIEGGMFAVWNDHCGNGITVDDIHQRLFPALQTIAAKCWSAGNVTLDYRQFDALRKKIGEGPDANRLARLPKGEKQFTIGKVLPGKDNKIKRIGYNYTVSFEIDYQQEELGTKLFTDDISNFYLSDPVHGEIGYSREGHLFTFGKTLTPGHHTIKVEGTDTYTRLTLDGEVSTQERHWIYIGPQRKSQMAVVPTLVFPLAHTGKFRSTVTNLHLEQEPQ